MANPPKPTPKLPPPTDRVPEPSSPMDSVWGALGAMGMNLALSFATGLVAGGVVALSAKETPLQRARAARRGFVVAGAMQGAVSLGAGLAASESHPHFSGAASLVGMSTLTTAALGAIVPPELFVPAETVDEVPPFEVDTHGLQTPEPTQGLQTPEPTQGDQMFRSGAGLGPVPGLLSRLGGFGEVPVERVRFAMPARAPRRPMPGLRPAARLPSEPLSSARFDGLVEKSPGVMDHGGALEGQCTDRFLLWTPLQKLQTLIYLSGTRLPRLRIDQSNRPFFTGVEALSVGRRLGWQVHAALGPLAMLVAQEACGVEDTNQTNEWVNSTLYEALRDGGPYAEALCATIRQVGGSAIDRDGATLDTLPVPFLGCELLNVATELTDEEIAASWVVFGQLVPELQAQVAHTLRGRVEGLGWPKESLPALEAVRRACEPYLNAVSRPIPTPSPGAPSPRYPLPTAKEANLRARALRSAVRGLRIEAEFALRTYVVATYADPNGVPSVNQGLGDNAASPYQPPTTMAPKRPMPGLGLVPPAKTMAPAAGPDDRGLGDGGVGKVDPNTGFSNGGAGGRTNLNKPGTFTSDQQPGPVDEACWQEFLSLQPGQQAARANRLLQAPYLGSEPWTLGNMNERDLPGWEVRLARAVRALVQAARDPRAVQNPGAFAKNLGAAQRSLRLALGDSNEAYRLRFCAPISSEFVVGLGDNATSPHLVNPVLRLFVAEPGPLESSCWADFLALSPMRQRAAAQDLLGEELGGYGVGVTLGNLTNPQPYQAQTRAALRALGSSAGSKTRIDRGVLEAVRSALEAGDVDSRFRFCRLVGAQMQAFQAEAAPALRPLRAPAAGLGAMPLAPRRR